MTTTPGKGYPKPMVESKGSHLQNSARIIEEQTIFGMRRLPDGRSHHKLYARPCRISLEQAMDIALDVDTALLRIGFDTSNISRT